MTIYSLLAIYTWVLIEGTRLYQTRLYKPFKVYIYIRSYWQHSTMVVAWRKWNILLHLDGFYLFLSQLFGLLQITSFGIRNQSVGIQI